jgi:hypothetical protein
MPDCACVEERVDEMQFWRLIALQGNTAVAGWKRARSKTTRTKVGAEHDLDISRICEVASRMQGSSLLLLTMLTLRQSMMRDGARKSTPKRTREGDLFQPALAL